MINRRQFAKASAATLAITSCASILRGQNLNSRLQVAGIGADGKGWSDIHEIASHAKTSMVGFCDIDLDRTQKVRALAPEAPIFQDYREMLVSLGDKIDAVTVSTPDHMHAIITLAAMKDGKHVYCQKPLTHNVWESRQVAAQTKKSNVITRLGNQIHSNEAYRSAVATLQAGAIGKVSRVHSWSAATGHGKSGFISLPPSPPPVPTSVAWDLWIGVAPMRPYGGQRVYHPFGWRDWLDFGNGALGDFGCHILDPVFTALGIDQPPTQIRATHSGMNDQVWPAQSTVEYVFPGTSWTTSDRLPLTWYDGGRLPSTKDSHLSATTALPSQGSMLIGETGTMVIPHYSAPRIYQDQRLIEDPIQKRESLNHYHGWVDGCINGIQPSDGFDYGALLTESVLLGTIAMRSPNEKLQWDAPAMRFTNNDASNHWVRREYREGWNIEPVV